MLKDTSMIVGRFEAESSATDELYASSVGRMTAGGWGWQYRVEDDDPSWESDHLDEEERGEQSLHFLHQSRKHRFSSTA